MKVRAAVVFALSLVMTIPGIAQTCSQQQFTNKLICTIPQLFGPQGLRLANPNHTAHFADISQSAFHPLSQGLGQALAILPLGSSGSGTTFTLDSQGHPVPTEDSLGPILTERANVIGRKAVSLGVAYQYFDFNRIDGIHLNGFQTILIHDKFDPSDTTSFRNDYIQTTNNAHVELNQTVVYAVFGIAKRMDASVELPIQAAHFRVTSAAHIVRTQPCEATATCSHDNAQGQPEQVCGEFHYFEGNANNCGLIFTSVDEQYPYPGAAGLITLPDGSSGQGPLRSGDPSMDAKGIGDITIRGKYEVLQGERFAGSVGLGVRFPSGDANNFLGTGAYGLIPFGAFTRAGRLSPHVRLGYEWNSKSVLAGDPSGLKNPETGVIQPASAKLPGAFLYSGGADYRATKWLTIAADLIGQRVISASRLTLGNYELLPPTDGKTIPSSSTAIHVPSTIAVNNSYSSDAIAVGGKLRLKRQLVLIGNATMRVDDGGLRANVVPLLGLSYAF